MVLWPHLVLLRAYFILFISYFWNYIHTYEFTLCFFNNKNIGCLLSYLSRNQKYFSAHSSVDFSKQALADVRNVSYITSFRQGFKYKS